MAGIDRAQLRQSDRIALLLREALHGGFDRVGAEKLHMQTLCGIAHYDFRARRAYSYEQAFSVMRNQDDHTKNISFLMDREGRWRLSPAYDMGFAYNPAGLWTVSHQMSINGKYDDIGRKDLLSFASSNGIKNASETIDRICEAAAGWSGIARNCGVPENVINAITPHLILQL